ncbi:MAG TPA: glycoside hydrolase family 3 N-terminal domain-containing protein [Ignavibacteriaceae bacterium]
MRNKLLLKNNLGFLSLVTLQFFFLFLPIVKSEVSSYPEEKTNTNTEDVFNLSKEDELWVENTLESMTIYDKCAQLFMPAVFGKSLDQSSYEFKSALELVKLLGIGGIVISTGDVDKTASMINELQRNSKIPLLVGADFENGIGMRMNASNTFPHSMAVGSTNNINFAYQTGKTTAIEALMLGVNFNFAPVADINNNPENPVINLRSYSEDKDIVTDFCKAYVEGSIEGGVIASAKHFPGHGNTKVDSHNDLPVINGDQKYLYENELKPFIELIKNGVQAIMIGHLNVPAFEPDKDLPSSLSYNIITKLLKEKLEFKGLIITDALDMKAVTKYYSTSEICLKAFKAGNDILLMPSNIRDGITAIYDAVNKGEITEYRLNESVRKILSAKRWLKLDQAKYRENKNLPKRIRMEEHYQLSKTIAEKSVTVVKMNNELIPFDSSKYKKTFIVNITNRKSISDPHFIEAYKENFSLYSSTTLNNSSKNRDYKAAMNVAKDCELIIVASYFSIKNDDNGNALSETQLKFFDDLLALKKRVIIISFENPYILSSFPQAENYICTFSNSKSSQRAVVNFLKGSIEPTGRLPVSIPNTGYQIGFRWEPNS